MADLGNRAAVDAAINALLDDLAPDGSILPSDHNGLLNDILDTLSNGLSTTLRTGNTTGGYDLDITDGDFLRLEDGSYFGSFDSATLTADRGWYFPDQTGTVALLSDIINGIENVTSAEKAALTPSTGEFVYDTDLDSLQRYNGSNWKTVAGYKPLGIADSEGSYTYYSDYTSAMADAVLGDTIEQFGNIIETGSVTITLKDRVRINMNGYKYQHINDDNIATFSSTVAITTKISNGTIIRNRTTAGSGIPLLQSTNADSIFDLTGVKLIVENCRAFWSKGTIIGAVVESEGTLTDSFYWIGSLYGTQVKSERGGTLAVLTGSVVKDCSFISSGSGFAIANTIINCHFEANTSGNAVTGGSGCVFQHSTVRQLGSGFSFRGSGSVEVHYSTVYATTNKSAFTGGDAKLRYSSFYSVSGDACSAEEGSAKYCEFTTDSGGSALYLFGLMDVSKCSLINNGTDASSYALGISNGDNGSNYIINNELITASATSEIMNIGGTNASKFIYLAKNSYKGGTGVITLPSTGNSQVSTEDSLGNIQID